MQADGAARARVGELPLVAVVGAGERGALVGDAAAVDADLAGRAARAALDAGAARRDAVALDAGRATLATGRAGALAGPGVQVAHTAREVAPVAGGAGQRAAAPGLAEPVDAGRAGHDAPSRIAPHTNAM